MVDKEEVITSETRWDLTTSTGQTPLDFFSGSVAAIYYF